MTLALTAPLGVCILPDPPRNAPRAVCYPHYIGEILAHAGLCHESVPPEHLAERLPGLRLLLTVGDAPLAAEQREALSSWVKSGGAWLAIGGVCGLGALCGVEAEPPAYATWGGGKSSLGEGYLIPGDIRHPVFADHPRVEGEPFALHYFNGLAVRAAGVTVLATATNAHRHPSPRAALTEIAQGAGRCVLIAPDVTGTIARIQQGVAITRDGVSAPDGTAPVCDGYLKSDDGAALDWIFDRQPVPAVPGFSAFLEPVADCWRDLLLRAVFYLAERQGVPLPLLWFHPRNIPAVGHISHDTDGNNPEEARQLLETLREAGIRSTWCVIAPGYAPDLMAAIKEAGHELAMHYDALEYDWSEEEFDRQWRQLVALFGGERPVSNKNHYLRWEGDTEFFSWCEKRGIQLDQSKGASKTGEAGFNFGTCHPYFPLAPDGSAIDVLELATPTQDLHVFAPGELREPLMQAALRRYGVLHLLFHPAHIFKPHVAESLIEAVRIGKERGMEWRTAAEIDRWERARRSVQWRDYAAGDGGAKVTLRAGEALPGATVLWLAAEKAEAKVEGKTIPAQLVERWGFRFRAVTFDATPGMDTTLEIGAER